MLKQCLENIGEGLLNAWKYTIIMDNQKSILFPIKVHTISILWIFKIFPVSPAFQA
jgi:hypothetical protein